MNKIKKSLSIFMAATFVMAGVLSNVTAKGAVVTQKDPIINYVGIEHSPLVVGDTETFTVTSSKYTGKVQYAAYFFDGAKWKKLQGYGLPVDSKTPYQLKKTAALKLGKYKVSVWVRKANVLGTKTNATGDFDSYYVAGLNCVAKNNATRVYANGAPKFETTGLTVKFNGIENIGGIPGPYLSRLFVMNPKTGVWGSGAKEYAATSSYTFAEPGTYMVIAHINTAKSTTWKNYLANNTKQKYEAWKTFMVTVNEDTLDVFDTTVKEATFGSLVNVTMTAEGTKEFATATKYQVFNGTSAISAVTALGTATTVFPAKVLGDKVNVKLLDATAKEVKTIEVALGQSGTIGVTPVVPVEPTTAEVKATVKTATFGALVNVTSTTKDAVKYQVFDGTKAISAIADLGIATTVFPGKAVGNKVNVKLLNATGTVVATSEATLVAAE